MLAKIAMICTAAHAADRPLPGPRNVRAANLGGAAFDFTVVESKTDLAERVGAALGVHASQVDLRTGEGLTPLPEDLGEWRAAAGEDGAVDVVYLQQDCPRCLPIELEDGPGRQAAWRELAETTITTHGNSYRLEGTFEDYNNVDYFLWRAQNGDASYIVCRKSHIGIGNPFFLFKEGDRSRNWFVGLGRENRRRVLEDLATNFIGRDTRRHIE